MVGSDGTIAGKLVEVKTISPEERNDHVLAAVKAISSSCSSFESTRSSSSLAKIDRAGWREGEGSFFEYDCETRTIAVERFR